MQDPVRHRSAVIDLGSNSVRLVVFDGLARNPTIMVNEKVNPRLGRGLQDSGLLDEGAMREALGALSRYRAIIGAMRASPAEILATAAVRDAANGGAFVEGIRARLPDVPIRILSGEQEAAYSAAGLACGIPEADGLMADIGGGSLELVPVAGTVAGRGRSFRLGVLRLADRAGGDLARAREIAEADLRGELALANCAGRDLYLVGGAFRALARTHMARTFYPLSIVHRYAIDRDAARELCGLVIATPRRALERLPGAPRRRAEDLPWAAVVLRRLLRLGAPRRVVFSASGLREGWYMGQLDAATRAEDAVLAAVEQLAAADARDAGLPPALVAWTAPLFPRETAEQARDRTCACWVSDIGSRDHPEYRAEQAVLRVLHQPGIAIDHRLRAVLAVVLAIRYDLPADHPALAQARHLLTPAHARHAETIGTALRLAYALCAGTQSLLANTRLAREGDRVVLTAPGPAESFGAEGVQRRLDSLAGLLGLPIELRLV